MRLRCKISRAREMPGGSLQAVIALAIEVGGAAKPALTADVGLVYARTAEREEPA